jgi:hypothetical protein
VLFAHQAEVTEVELGDDARQACGAHGLGRGDVRAAPAVLGERVEGRHVGAALRQPVQPVVLAAEGLMDLRHGAEVFGNHVERAGHNRPRYR